MCMPSLHEVQHRFKQGVLNEDPAFHVYIKKNKRLHPERLLQVYRNNYYISLTEALENIYPLTQKLVGKDFFAATAKAYIRCYPSISGDLHEFGGQLSRFLDDFPPTQTLPYLPEIAQMEWAGHQAYHAEESPVVDWQILAKIPEESYGKIKLQLTAACHLFAFKFPVLAIRDFCYEPHSEHLNLDSNGEYVLVTRRNMQIYFEKLTAGEYVLLLALQQGRHMQEACCMAIDTESTVDINIFLQKHFMAGTFQKIDWS
ncbi:DNA-binding domain-containing protein [Legionella oakridgensis]|uniref:Putative DNA-binding domain-containing protein n=1 Tax=Legionella oakridgensis TaxID=29423 RepID=A0A0W0WY89_9GAMM|nr:DNA-binding domain-containing protein [Legionella oakridgensis]KTD37204.1 hypothetical protein Loak_2340 [Legionella oakridgensis]STY20148.1 Uncharacterized protein conserved in bacteria [Legionella longbeachae]